ncbi:MAG: radical SAM-associated putative lipoprotein [Paludibacteraceae bacterium]|nr:radical SAM-associated putative lipoprotein [Paludibacteraceae bacterium]
MKKRMLIIINSLLTALLGLFGFSSCFRVAYGTYHANFIVEGTVCNEDDEPLKNIQVVYHRGWRGETYTPYWLEPDTLYTNEDGKFYQLSVYNGSSEFQKLVVNDTTGVYASDSIDTSVTNSDGNSRWYLSTGELKADFVLKKK